MSKQRGWKGNLVTKRQSIDDEEKHITSKLV